MQLYIKMRGKLLQLCISSSLKPQCFFSNFGRRGWCHQGGNNGHGHYARWSKKEGHSHHHQQPQLYRRNTITKIQCKPIKDSRWSRTGYTLNLAITIVMQILEDNKGSSIWACNKNMHNLDNTNSISLHILIGITLTRMSHNPVGVMDDALRL